ncbi:MAG: phosphatase PAP2 family protein [Alphaproteobacteria bacterium]|nr:phosphatase PAP2 family protein [Alphaproteobacteria bacterium]
MSMDAVTLQLPRHRVIGGLVARSFAVQWILFLVPVLFLLTNTALLWNAGTYAKQDAMTLLSSVMTITLPVGIAIVALFRLVQLMVVIRPPSLFAAMGADMRMLVARPQRLIAVAPVIAAVMVFNKALLEMKIAIPLVQPFTWDKAFVSLDRALHFGVDPWRLIQPFMGFPWLTYAVNVTYIMWFLALFGAWFWFGFQARLTEERTRFFLAYMMTWWIGGGLLSVAFSSAGPVYLDRLGVNPNPYTGLFAYLDQVHAQLNLGSANIQQALWDGYVGKIPAMGISAFPSMHNATAALFVMAFWKTSRAAGIAFIVYGIIILLGSIHLGWHYAVDGYGGVLIALLCWWLAGPIARWYCNLPSTRRFNEDMASL